MEIAADNTDVNVNNVCLIYELKWNIHFHSKEINGNVFK